MRSKKELLSIVLENTDKLESGLCGVLYRLYSEGVITFDEERALNKHIRRHGPKMNYTGPEERLWYRWPYGEKEPRIEWLKAEIGKQRVGFLKRIVHWLRGYLKTIRRSN